jgi:hypothetical protein
MIRRRGSGKRPIKDKIIVGEKNFLDKIFQKLYQYKI